MSVLIKRVDEADPEISEDLEVLETLCSAGWVGAARVIADRLRKTTHHQLTRDQQRRLSESFEWLDWAELHESRNGENSLLRWEEPSVRAAIERVNAALVRMGRPNFQLTPPSDYAVISYNRHFRRLTSEYHRWTSWLRDRGRRQRSP